MRKKKKYTVLLLLPDLYDKGLKDSFLAHVITNTPNTVFKKACRMYDPRRMIKDEAFTLLGIFPGHIEDLSDTVKLGAY